MEFVLTHIGAAIADAMLCTTCADMDGVVSTMQDGVNRYSYPADAWNSTFKPPGQAFDAKAGTSVCFWSEPYPKTGLGASCTGVAFYSGGTVGPSVAIYFGTDNKWHMTYVAFYSETYSTYSSTLSGDVEFAGGGAPMDCGTPGEATPTFSLTIPLSEYNQSGTQFCFPPTSVLVEGNPQ